jgi:hypothetical protein
MCTHCQAFEGLNGAQEPPEGLRFSSFLVKSSSAFLHNLLNPPREEIGCFLFSIDLYLFILKIFIEIDLPNTCPNDNSIPLPVCRGLAFTRAQKALFYFIFRELDRARIAPVCKYGAMPGAC